MLQKLLGVVAVALMAIAVVSGCSGDSDDESSPTAANDVRGTLTWAMFDYDPGVKAWANDMARTFERRHPDVDVEVVLAPVNSYQQLLTTQLRGRKPPDLAGVPTAWIPAFVEADALSPWNDYVGERFLDRIEPRLLDGAQSDGEVYALPYLSTSRALFINDDAFQKAGLSGPPKTWDDLVRDARRIVAKGAAKHGFALQGAGNEAFAAWFPYVYWSYGGELADADGKLVVDEAACLDGVSVLKELVDAKVTQPDVTGSDVPEQLNLFTSGQAAMTITGPWLIGTLAADAKNLRYSVAPIPEGVAATTLDVQDAYVLFKDGGNTDAAAAFAEFLFEPKNADEFVEGRGMLPVLEEGFSAPRYEEPPLKTFVDLVRRGKFVPNDSRWLKLTDSGTRALQAMYTNGASVQETCDAIRAEIES